MDYLVDNDLGAECHSPCGECGLKYVDAGAGVGVCWVTPHAGSVD